MYLDRRDIQENSITKLPIFGDIFGLQSGRMTAPKIVAPEQGEIWCRQYLSRMKNQEGHWGVLLMLGRKNGSCEDNNNNAETAELTIRG